MIVYAVPLHKRPKYQGFFGAVFGVSSVAGPLIGGAFTTNVTWRWNFYLNLPLGAIVMLLVFFLLKIPDRPNTQIPFKDKLRQLNALGLLALLPGVVCLCLALQWGGTTYAVGFTVGMILLIPPLLAYLKLVGANSIQWSEGRIIALLVLAFALLIAFALIQVWKPEQATLPPRILTQRSILSGFWVSACLGAHLNVFGKFVVFGTKNTIRTNTRTLVYYLPIWFQAVDGISAIKSGIHLLPMLLAVVLGSIVTGILVSRIGYYTPFMIFGVCLTTIGAGLLTTLQVDTTEGKWIGFQFLYGLGFGACAQAPNMAAQTVLQREDVAIGASLMFFGLQLFGAIFTSVSLNVLDNQLAKRLLGIPGITPHLIQTTGATDILSHIHPEYHEAALIAYNSSLRVCFQIGLIMACIAIPGALGMEWRTVRKNIPPKNPDGERTAEEGKGSGDLSVEVAPKPTPEAKTEVELGA